MWVIGGERECVCGGDEGRSSSMQARSVQNSKSQAKEPMILMTPGHESWCGFRKRSRSSDLPDMVRFARDNPRSRQVRETDGSSVCGLLGDELDSGTPRQGSQYCIAISFADNWKPRRGQQSQECGGEGSQSCPLDQGRRFCVFAKTIGLKDSLDTGFVSSIQELRILLLSRRIGIGQQRDCI